MSNKCLGVFLVVITIPLVMLSIFLLASTNFTKSIAYKDLFQKSETYKAVVNIVPKNNDGSNLTGIIQSKMTPSWLEQNVEKNLDSLFTYLNGKNQKFDFSVDIAPFKDDIAAGLPPETQKYVPTTLSLESYTEFLKQTQNMVSQVSSLGQGNDTQITSEISNQIQSSDQFNQKFSNNANSLKRSFRNIKIAAYIIYALTLLMLLIIILLSRHYIPAIFRWTGVTLLVSGILSFVIALLNQKIVLGLNLIDKIKMSTEVKTIVVPLTNNIIAQLSTNIGRISLAIVIVSAIMIIFSYVLAKFVKLPPGPTSTPTPPVANKA